MTEEKPQCEGWRRYGGAFTLGPVLWKRCKRPGEVILTFKDESGKTKSLPACKVCWDECISNKVTILEVLPIL